MRHYDPKGLATVQEFDKKFEFPVDTQCPHCDGTGRLDELLRTCGTCNGYCSLCQTYHCGVFGYCVTTCKLWTERGDEVLPCGHQHVVCVRINPPDQAKEVIDPILGFSEKGDTCPKCNTFVTPWIVRYEEHPEGPVLIWTCQTCGFVQVTRPADYKEVDASDEEENPKA